MALRSRRLNKGGRRGLGGDDNLGFSADTAVDSPLILEVLDAVTPKPVELPVAPLLGVTLWETDLGDASVMGDMRATECSCHRSGRVEDRSMLSISFIGFRSLSPSLVPPAVEAAAEAAAVATRAALCCCPSLSIVECLDGVGVVVVVVVVPLASKES